MFSKKVVYYVREKKGLKTAPKKVVIFNWTKFNYDDFKNINKMEYVFVNLSNILFNFEDLGLLKYTLNDIKKYLQMYSVKDSVLRCSYAENPHKELVVVELGYKGTYGQLNISLSSIPTDFIKPLAKLFVETLFWFYKLPNDVLKKEFRRFEEYLKLRYNIRRFDIEYTRRQESL